MTKPLRILMGLAGALILIGAGFGVGLFINHQSSITPPSATPETVAQETGPAQPTSTINLPIYKTSPPSKGRAYSYVPVALDNLYGQVATVFLHIDQAGDIKPLQNVLLYNAEDELIELSAAVADVTTGQGKYADVVTVKINITSDVNIPASTAKSGEIVTEKVLQADRLPVSALQKTEDGKAFVWEAVRQQDSTAKATRRFPLSVRVMNDDFFIMKNPEYKSDIYILNPDDALKDGQTIALNETLYSPGPVANDDEIAAIRPAKFYYEPKSKVMPSACSSECGGGGGGGSSAAFIQKIKELAKDLPQQSTP